MQVSNKRKKLVSFEEDTRHKHLIVVNTLFQIYTFVQFFRLAQIELNMKNMPKIIEDYRKRMRELKAKRREEKRETKLKAAEAQRLGLNVRDPRALQMLDRDKKVKNKKNDMK